MSKKLSCRGAKGVTGKSKKYSQECSSQLIEVCGAHKNVDAEQAPIFRYDHQGISRPYHAGSGQRGALRDAQFFCRTSNVADASDHQALNSTVYLKHNGQRTRVAICRLFTHLNAGAQKKMVLGPVETKTTRVKGCTCTHCVNRCLVRARLRYGCEREFGKVQVVRTSVVAVSEETPFGTNAMRDDNTVRLRSTIVVGTMASELVRRQLHRSFAAVA